MDDKTNQQSLWKIHVAYLHFELLERVRNLNLDELIFIMWKAIESPYFGLPYLVEYCARHNDFFIHDDVDIEQIEKRSVEIVCNERKASLCSCFLG